MSNFLNRRIRPGFSLVELVVVLAVVALIAAIAVPTFSTVRTNTASKVAEASAEAVARNAFALATAGSAGAGVSAEVFCESLKVSLSESPLIDLDDPSFDCGTIAPETAEYTWDLRHNNGRVVPLTFNSEQQRFQVGSAQAAVGAPASFNVVSEDGGIQVEALAYTPGDGLSMALYFDQAPDFTLESTPFGVACNKADDPQVSFNLGYAGFDSEQNYYLFESSAPASDIDSLPGGDYNCFVLGFDGVSDGVFDVSGTLIAFEDIAESEAQLAVFVISRTGSGSSGSGSGAGSEGGGVPEVTLTAQPATTLVLPGSDGANDPYVGVDFSQVLSGSLMYLARGDFPNLFVNNPTTGSFVTDPSEVFIQILGTAPASGSIVFEGTQQFGFSLAEPDASESINGRVLAAAQQPDGKTIIGGSFTSIAGNAYSGVARLNADGTLDTSFQNPGIDMGDLNESPGVLALALQSDGKILVGGSFPFSPSALGNIVRLNSNGTLDTTWSPVFEETNVCAGPQEDPEPCGETTDWIGGWVESMAVDSAGRILVGGHFGSKVLRLTSTGEVDGSFETDAFTGPFGGLVKTVAVDSSDRVLVGGKFETIDGEPRLNVARLTTSGALDTSFTPATIDDVNDVVWAVASTPDGKVIIAGQFDTVGGQSRAAGVARLTSGGALDTTFVTDLSSMGSPFVRSVRVLSDGRVAVSNLGGYLNSNGNAVGSTLLLTSNGSRDMSVSYLFGGAEAMIALDSDGTMMFGSQGSESGDVFGRVSRFDVSGLGPNTVTVDYTLE